MKKFVFTFWFLLLAMTLWSQSTVQYDVEPAVSKIQEDYVAQWEKIGEMDGYRIQILAISGTNSKGQATSAKSAFETQFPEIPAYMSYAEPYFRIRVGDFFNRIDAYRTLLQIQYQYPNAFIIMDKVSYLNN